jgi:hypothetical protein
MEPAAANPDTCVGEDVGVGFGVGVGVGVCVGAGLDNTVLVAPAVGEHPAATYTRSKHASRRDVALGVVFVSPQAVTMARLLGRHLKLKRAAILLPRSVV